MTDEQIWNFFHWLGYLLAGAAVVGFTVRGYITRREINGLKAENNNLKTLHAVANERRLLAEDQRKFTEDKLRAVEAKSETAEAQIKDHAPSEALAATIQQIKSSTYGAMSSNTQIGELLKPIEGTITVYVSKVSNKLEDPKKIGPPI